MGNSNRSSEAESFWRSVHDKYRGSGLTVRAYCLRKDVSEASFYAWRKELAKRDSQRKSAARQQGLIPVRVAESVGHVSTGVEGPRRGELSVGGPWAAPLVEVVTPAGFTLRFRHDIEPDRLVALLRVVQQQSPCRGKLPC